MTAAAVVVVLLGLATVAGMLFATPPAGRLAWRLGRGAGAPRWQRPFDHLLDRAGQEIAGLAPRFDRHAVVPPLPPIAEGDVFFAGEPSPRLQP